MSGRVERHDRDIRREYYDEAQRWIASGRWTVDAAAGKIWSGRYRRWFKQKPHPDGYCRIAVTVDGRQHGIVTHRVIWEFAHGPIPLLLEVNHKNGVKSDNRIANLELATARENSRHAIETGLLIPDRGSEHGSAILDEAKVRKIRRLCAKGGIEGQEIARMFGVSKATISMIKTRKTWRHI